MENSKSGSKECSCFPTSPNWVPVDTNRKERGSTPSKSPNLVLGPSGYYQKRRSASTNSVFSPDLSTRFENTVVTLPLFWRITSLLPHPRASDHVPEAWLGTLLPRDLLKMARNSLPLVTDTYLSFLGTHPGHIPEAWFDSRERTMKPRTGSNRFCHHFGREMNEELEVRPLLFSWTVSQEWFQSGSQSP